MLDHMFPDVQQFEILFLFHFIVKTFDMIFYWFQCGSSRDAQYFPPAIHSAQCKLCFDFMESPLLCLLSAWKLEPQLPGEKHRCELEEEEEVETDT